MPPVPTQNADAKIASQQKNISGGEQRNKNINGNNINGNKNNTNGNSHITNGNSHYIQPIQSHNRQTPSMTAATASSSSSQPYHHPMNTVSSAMPQPTPLFERLVTEEVQELKAYARIIENQNRRLVELERIHGDLESRLELESRGRTQLEATLERRERDWAMKYHKLEKDRDQWKSVVSQEQVKNARLIDQVVRKDQDIHRMLQRKVSRHQFKGKNWQSIG